MVPYKLLFFISVLFSFGLLVSLVSFAVVDLESFANSSYDQEIALVTHVGKPWGFNQYNSSEILFDVSIYNYGYSEARNMQVTCEMYEGDREGNFKNETPFLNVTKKIGNLASTSYKDVQLSIASNPSINDYTLSYCFILSCENCEILDNRLHLAE